MIESVNMLCFLYEHSSIANLIRSLKLLERLWPWITTKNKNSFSSNWCLTSLAEL